VGWLARKYYGWIHPAFYAGRFVNLLACAAAPAVVDPPTEQPVNCAEIRAWTTLVAPNHPIHCSFSATAFSECCLNC
jgi:hypothetical protein